MILPNATLFPQALLPLYMFEPRYRRMLADALASHRMFVVAMQRPGCKNESPAPVAGLGLIRVAVGHDDGTSHLVLQGLARVELLKAVRYRPYRLHRVRALCPGPCECGVTLDALLARVRKLLADRVQLGLPFPFPVFSQGNPNSKPAFDNPAAASGVDVMQFLNKVEDPDQFADLISCAVITRAEERQSMLEIVDVERRLQQLVRYLIADIARHRKH